MTALTVLEKSAELNTKAEVLGGVKTLPKLEAVKKLQQDAYHIMQGMNGIHPGDPTYNTDLNLETYQKTM